MKALWHVSLSRKVFSFSQTSFTHTKRFYSLPNEPFCFFFFFFLSRRWVKVRTWSEGMPGRRSLGCHTCYPGESLLT